MSEQEPRLIVGLGNPGRDYQNTRHNLGFLVVRNLAKRYRLNFIRSVAFKGFITQGQLEKRKTYLFLPLTYMNHSGVGVRAVVVAKKILLKDILVVSDDLDLDFGQVRLRAKGSDGGHNGLNSLIVYLKTQEFARLRLGIGRPTKKEETVDFVLSEFNTKEKEELSAFVEKATDCCRTWLAQGTTEAMNQFNEKGKR